MIYWNQPLEWSTGEATTLRRDLSDDSIFYVEACKRWTDLTSDVTVAVDKTTGQILGNEREGLPHVRNVREAPVYLHLFHGRAAPDAEMDGWGHNGPTIGPLNYVHMTYMCDMKYGFQDAADAANFGLDEDGNFEIVEGLIKYRDAYYGDWSVNGFKATGAYRIDVMEGDDVVKSEKFEGTELDAERKLGDIWSNGPWVTADAGRYRAVLYCVSGDHEVQRQEIAPEADDD